MCRTEERDVRLRLSMFSSQEEARIGGVCWTRGQWLSGLIMDHVTGRLKEHDGTADLVIDGT